METKITKICLMKEPQSDVSKKKYRSVKYKINLVLELLRGEPAEHLARREGLTLAILSQWRSTFVKAGTEGFKSKNSKENKELKRARNLIASQAMELALYKQKMAHLNEKTP